jgi:hypothetical protein
VHRFGKSFIKLLRGELFHFFRFNEDSYSTFCLDAKSGAKKSRRIMAAPMRRGFLILLEMDTVTMRHDFRPPEGRCVFARLRLFGDFFHLTQKQGAEPVLIINIYKNTLNLQRIINRVNLNKANSSITELQYHDVPAPYFSPLFFHELPAIKCWRKIQRPSGGRYS